MVIDIKTGEPLTEEELKLRKSFDAPEKAARNAIADAFDALRQLQAHRKDAAWTEAVNNAVHALRFACTSNGLDPMELELGMKPIGAA